MLSQSLEYSLNAAFQCASNKKHKFLTVEHLFWALLSDPEVNTMLAACGANIDELKSNTADYLDQSIQQLNVNKDDEPEKETKPAIEFQRVLQRAVFQAQSVGRREATTINVLIAIFGEIDSYAVKSLQKYNITRIDIINYVSKHGVSFKIYNNDQESSEQTEQESSETSVLDSYTVNLNEKAKKNKIDTLIGRNEEVERTIQILCRRRKNNPLLVGEAGVGKTAVAEGLAKKIVDKSVPDIMLNAVIYSLDMGSLLAGTKYRGDFEKRLKSVLNALDEQDHAVLFIDEIHTIVGAGVAGGSMDASNLIKPALASGDLKCIGSTTYAEYRTIFEKDHALARRFQKIDITEPTIGQTIDILKGLKPYFEKHHSVKYSIHSLESAAELSAKYINERFLPDKAIDVIDEVGALQAIVPKSKRKKIINVADIEQVVAKIARIPMKSVSSDDKKIIASLEENLKMLVYGQNQAVETLVETIKLARAGLRDKNKPWGSFLFSGPTGVGKTEVTNQLAHLLGIQLLRFDMSEYMERHAISRLIGSPPGYVGYDDGGLLTDAILKNPYSIVLLDEIEKAHPDIYNILLQVMDNGMLTDSAGRKVDCRNVILIMTTNAGAFELQKNSMGFAKQESATNEMTEVKRLFTPEFRNRLDTIIQFSSLSKSDIILVVDKFLAQLQGQLDSKGVSLEISKNAKIWLSENGFDEKMGARPMGRLIQEVIKKPLAEQILFDKLNKGGTVKISLKNNKLSFQYN